MLKNYSLIVTLVDSGLPYENEGQAMEDAQALALTLADSEGLDIGEVKVVEEVDEV